MALRVAGSNPVAHPISHFGRIRLPNLPENQWLAEVLTDCEAFEPLARN